MYRIIATNVDKTLLRTDDRSVSLPDCIDIALAREVGTRHVSATSSTFASVERTLDELVLKSPF